MGSEFSGEGPRQGAGLGGAGRGIQCVGSQAPQLIGPSSSEQNQIPSSSLPRQRPITTLPPPVLSGTKSRSRISFSKLGDFGAVSIGCQPSMRYLPFLKMSLLALSGASALVWFAIVIGRL